MRCAHVRAWRLPICASPGLVHSFLLDPCFFLPCPFDSNSSRPSPTVPSLTQCRGQSQFMPAPPAPRNRQTWVSRYLPYGDILPPRCQAGVGQGRRSGMLRWNGREGSWRGGTDSDEWTVPDCRTGEHCAESSRSINHPSSLRIVIAPQRIQEDVARRYWHWTVRPLMGGVLTGFGDRESPARKHFSTGRSFGKACYTQ